MRAVAVVALVLTATTAAADNRLGAGYMMGRPIAGETGGVDHALALHGEHVMTADVDLGVTVELGYTPGNDAETLKRLAIMPMLGVHSEPGDLVVRADLCAGWQVADGRTRIGPMPVAGTEARGVRAELAIGLEAAVSRRTTLRAVPHTPCRNARTMRTKMAPVIRPIPSKPELAR